MQARILRKPISFHTSRYFLHYPAVEEGKDPAAEELYIMLGADNFIRDMLKSKYILAEADATTETVFNPDLPGDSSSNGTSTSTENSASAETSTSTETGSAHSSTTEGSASKDADSSKNADSSKEDQYDQAAAKLIARLPEQYLVDVPHFPQRLGRVSSKVTEKGLFQHNEPSPLATQLQILRRRKPEKEHFRIALVNGLGGALGDCLMGMTALREVARVLGEHLPSFALDVLYGPESRAGNAMLVGGEPYVEQVLYQELHMADFAAYDAYFDCTGLILLPRYNELPSVDFMLWWFGLDHEAVPAEHKRNRANVLWQHWNAVAELLRSLPTEGRKLIFFNPKASCRARSIPKELAESMLKKMLNLDKNLHFIIDQPLSITHARVSCVEKQINNPELFKALVSQMDGLISVDSFGPHFADVASVPSVQINALLPTQFYPYYPYNTIVELPGMKTLPGYLKCKDGGDDEWKSWEKGYTSAWKKVKPARLLELLHTNMQKRAANTGEKPGLTIIGEQPPASCIVSKKNFSSLRHDRLSPLWLPTQLRIANLCARILKQGSVAVLAGAGQTALSEMLINQCGPKGMLHIFEPRTIRAQLIAGDLVKRSLFSFTMHPEELLDAVPETRQVSYVCPWSEADPYHWGNVPRNTTIPVRTLDSLNLPFCHAIVIQPPFAALQVLQGGLETIRRTSPILVAGPLSMGDCAVLTKVIGNENYVFWLKGLDTPGKLDQALLLGLPATLNCTVEGFMKVEHKEASKTPNVVPAHLDGIDPFVMHVHPEGHDSILSPSLRATGMWDSFETQVFKHLCKKGYSMLDVGANIGWYTVVAGLLTGPMGRVVAIEPSPDNAALLQKNIHSNKLDKYTTLEQCALSDTPGEAALYLAPNNMGDHRLAAAADSRQHINVRVCTIDELWQNERGQFDIVKMDAQGFEAKILKGAEKCFAAGWRPILFFEFSPGLIVRAGDDPLQFLTNIFDKNSKLFQIDARQRQLYSITAKDLTPIFEASKKHDEVYVDIVAIPIENDAIAAMERLTVR